MRIGTIKLKNDKKEQKCHNSKKKNTTWVQYSKSFEIMIALFD